MMSLKVALALFFVRVEFGVYKDLVEVGQHCANYTPCKKLGGNSSTHTFWK